MKLCRISYNSQGLTTRGACLNVNCFIQTFEPRIDFLCVQEHKVRGHVEFLLKQEIWRDALFLISPAFDGVCAHRNPLVPGGHGSLFTAIAPRIKDLISDHGITPSGLGIWVHLQHVSFGQLGIINVYAPNDD